MYVLILVVVVAIILVNLVISSSLFTTKSFLYAQKPPAKKSTTTGGGTGPAASLVKNAEKFFNKNPKRITNPPSAYKGLVTGGYIKQTGNKITVNTSPPGQPPVKGTGGQAPGGSGNVWNNPNPTKPVRVNIGGKTGVESLLQYKKGEGALKVTNNGKNISGTINPSTCDGSKLGCVTRRDRSEIASRGKELTKVKNVAFVYQATGTENILPNKSGIFYQIKPGGDSGGNDSHIRLAVKDGVVAAGLNGGNTIPLKIKDENGKKVTIDARNKNAFEIKINPTGKDSLYVNGQEALTFNMPKVQETTNFKIGFETVKGQLKGDFGGSYTDYTLS